MACGAGLSIRSAPRILISAESVQQGKPHPEAYLAAATQLRVDPRHCVVVEDAPAGISAGRAARAVIEQLAHLHVEALPTQAEARLRVHLKARV